MGVLSRRQRRHTGVGAYRSLSAPHHRMCWVGVLEILPGDQRQNMAQGKGLAGAKRSSRFWASRVERNGPGRYDINNVIGANEWQENIDNNAFTNGMAITALRYAVQAATELGLTPDPDWSHVADNIPILKFPDGTTKENATYDGVDIKQADANLLSYPLEIVTDAAKVRQDLNYYQPRYSKEGPAMGAAILAVLYCRLGDYNKAAEIFLPAINPMKCHRLV